jgi:cytoskeletal protein CcmA (bactofilin family)
MAIFSSGTKDTKSTDESRSAPPGGGNSLSIIAAGTRIDGDIETDGVIRIEGTVEGSIRAGRQVLVGRQGTILGDIVTREAVIGGRVEGTISATERLEVQSTSLIVGDIITRSIAVVEGGKINGTVRIADARESAEGASAAPTPPAMAAAS